MVSEELNVIMLDAWSAKVVYALDYVQRKTWIPAHYAFIAKFNQIKNYPTFLNVFVDNDAMNLKVTKLI